MSASTSSYKQAILLEILSTEMSGFSIDGACQ